MAVPLEAFTSFFANTIKNILPKNVRIFDVLVASLMWCVFTEAAIPNISLLSALNEIFRYAHLDTQWYTIVQEVARLNGVFMFCLVTLSIGNFHVAYINRLEMSLSYAPTWIILSLTMITLRGTTPFEWIIILSTSGILFIFGNAYQFPESRPKRLENLVAFIRSLISVAFSPIYLLYNIVTASTQLPETMAQNDYLRRMPSGAIY